MKSSLVKRCWVSGEKQNFAYFSMFSLILENEMIVNSVGEIPFPVVRNDMKKNRAVEE